MVPKPSPVEFHKVMDMAMLWYQINGQFEFYRLQMIQTSWGLSHQCWMNIAVSVKGYYDPPYRMRRRSSSASKVILPAFSVSITSENTFRMAVTSIHSLMSHVGSRSSAHVYSGQPQYVFWRHQQRHQHKQFQMMPTWNVCSQRIRVVPIMRWLHEYHLLSSQWSRGTLVRKSLRSR